MDQLPLVLLLRIAEDSVDAWRSFVLAHPRIGKWSLQPEYQKYIQRRFTLCIEYQPESCGVIREYKLCNKIHNVDGPAVEDTDGYKYWYKNGQLHRDGDLPAIERSDKYKAWYQNGKRHRDGDLPAVEKIGWDNEIIKSWYKNGLRHRDGDLPAVDKSDGTKEWYKNGKRHRDGNSPAVKLPSGYKEWYNEGKRGKYYVPTM